MTTYTTKQGDMWDSIAKSQLGSEKYIKELMEANKSYLSTLIFSAGVVLIIPGIDNASNTDSSSLPPWRR